MIKLVQTCCQERMLHLIQLDYTLFQTHQSFHNMHFDHSEDVNSGKNHLQVNHQCIIISLSSKWRNVLVLLEGSSSSTCQHPSPRVDCLQTFPFSLHLSKHAVPFRRFMSRGLPTFLRTPGNQPSKVFLHPQNVKLSLPQDGVFESRGIQLHCIELIITAHAERTMGKFLQCVQFIEKIG